MKEVVDVGIDLSLELLNDELLALSAYHRCGFLTAFLDGILLFFLDALLSPLCILVEYLFYWTLPFDFIWVLFLEWLSRLDLPCLD